MTVSHGTLAGLINEQKAHASDQMKRSLKRLAIGFTFHNHKTKCVPSHYVASQPNPTHRISLFTLSTDEYNKLLASNDI